LFIAEFVLFLSPLKLRTGEMIYEKGQHPNSVFFIIKGKVGLVEGPDKMVYKSFVPGGYFGEIEIFSECVRSFLFIKF
jgi:hyperpolarization activated cyclic nucleotide-gated potassium channel 1